MKCIHVWREHIIITPHVNPFKPVDDFMCLKQGQLPFAKINVCHWVWMADELLTGRCLGSHITAVSMLDEATFREGMRNKCHSAGLYSNTVVLSDFQESHSGSFITPTYWFGARSTLRLPCNGGCSFLVKVDSHPKQEASSYNKPEHVVQHRRRFHENQSRHLDNLYINIMC